MTLKVYTHIFTKKVVWQTVLLISSLYSWRMNVFYAMQLAERVKGQSIGVLHVTLIWNLIHWQTYVQLNVSQKLRFTILKLVHVILVILIVLSVRVMLIDAHNVNLATYWTKISHVKPPVMHLTKSQYLIYANSARILVVAVVNQ